MPYECLVQNYKNDDVEDFNWEKPIENNDTDRQSCLFNKTVINIFHNYNSK